MKRTVMILIMLFPVAALAQENAPSALTDQTTATASIQVGSPATDPGASAYSDPSSSTAPTIGQDATTQQSQTAKSPKSSKPSGDVQRPVIEGSMVGYIDNAIVGSEIRVRFDAGFHDNAPDRAEFFYAQCGCNGGNAPGPSPGLVADLNFQQLYFRGEYAPISRFSIFTEVPVRWIQPQAFVTGTGSFPNHAGLNDVLAGVKFAAIASSSRYLTFQFQASFPSGDASKGLGTNHYSVEPELLYYQKISDRASLEAMLGDTHPIGGSTFTFSNGVTRNFAGDVFFYGVGPSYVLYKGDRVQFAPVIELVGWSVLGGLESNARLAEASIFPVVSADGTNIVNLKVGARTAIGDHNSIYVGYGHQLTHNVWYKEILRLEYRYSF